MDNFDERYARIHLIGLFGFIGPAVRAVLYYILYESYVPDPVEDIVTNSFESNSEEDLHLHFS